MFLKITQKKLLAKKNELNLLKKYNYTCRISSVSK